MRETERIAGHFEPIAGSRGAFSVSVFTGRWPIAGRHLFARVGDRRATEHDELGTASAPDRAFRECPSRWLPASSIPGSTRRIGGKTLKYVAAALSAELPVITRLGERLEESIRKNNSP